MSATRHNPVTKTGTRPGSALLPLSSIRPAPVNDLVYGVIDPDGPSLDGLVKSLREHGQFDPILVSTDDVIISGHRRFAAARRLGWTHINAVRESIRLDAAGADVKQVFLLSGVMSSDRGTAPTERMITLADVAVLEAALRAHPDCRLVTVDPIGSYLGGETDAHRDNEVRAVLRPIADLAGRYGVAVVLVAHRRKSSGDFADGGCWGAARSPASPARCGTCPATPRTRTGG